MHFRSILVPLGTMLYWLSMFCLPLLWHVPSSHLCTRDITNVVFKASCNLRQCCVPQSHCCSPLSCLSAHSNCNRHALALELMLHVHAKIVQLCSDIISQNGLMSRLYVIFSNVAGRITMHSQLTYSVAWNRYKSTPAGNVCCFTSLTAFLAMFLA